MKRMFMVALPLLLLVGCGQADNALFPELKGRWAPEKGARARLVLASTNTSIPIVPPSLQELCQNEYITFNRYPPGSDFQGGVILHQQGKRRTIVMVASAAREGTRVILNGQEPNDPLAGGGRMRLELVLRNGEVAFDDVIDARGRSVRYDRINVPDPIRAQRAGLVTVGDMLGMLLNLKRCPS